MAKPGSDRDGAMVDKQAGKKSKDKLSPFTKTPKLDRSELLGKEGKAKSSMKRKLSFTSSPPRNAEERDSDTDKDGPDKKKMKKEAGGKKSQAPNLLFGYPLSERKQMALLMQMTANSPDSTPSHPSQTTPVQKKVPSSASSRQKDKVNKRNERGETPLHMAAIRGDAKQVKELISLGADVNVKDFAGWTPLHEACNLGYYDVAKVLIAAGAEVNTQGLDDDTPLHDASSSGHKDIVKLLLRHGGNAFQANKRGERPVDVADSQELEQLLKGEVPLSDQEDSSSESEDPPSVNPSSVDDNMEDSETEKDSEGKAATKASSSVPGLDEYEFKDEEEEEDLSKALNDRHILRRELRQREKEDKERNHVAGKQSAKGGGGGDSSSSSSAAAAKPKKQKGSRLHGGSDSSSDEMESLPEKRNSPTCSQSSESLRPDGRSKKEDKDKDKGKVKRKSKSQNKNKENQEDGKENSKTTLLLALAGVSEAEKGREEDSFKMSFSPKDDSSVHLFHLSSIKSPKLNHSLTDKQTPLKQENAKTCVSIADAPCPADGVKYNHYAEAEFCSEASSTRGCKHKEKSKHQQKEAGVDGEDGRSSPARDGGGSTGVDDGGGASRKTDVDGKVVKKHKLKHKEKDKHKREYEAERGRHRPKDAKKDGHRNLEFDREFWKENFFKSDETDDAKRDGEDKSAGGASPKEKHKEKRPRDERERDKAAKKDKARERDEKTDLQSSGRIPEEPPPAPSSNSVKEESEEKPVAAADQEQPESAERSSRERTDKRLPGKEKDPEKTEKRHPDKEKKIKTEHSDKSETPNSVERWKDKESADKSSKENEKTKSASAAKKHDDGRKNKERLEKRSDKEREYGEHRDKERSNADRKAKALPEKTPDHGKSERSKEKDCDKKKRDKVKDGTPSSNSNLKLLLEEKKSYAADGKSLSGKSKDDAAAKAPEKDRERRERDRDGDRHKDKDRHKESRLQQARAGRTKPGEADAADKPKSKPAPSRDAKPKEKRLVNDDLMQTSFERMLSLKDQEIEQWHRKHLEKIKQKERERLKHRPLAELKAKLKDRSRTEAACLGKELLRSKSSEASDKPAAKEVSGPRTVSLDGRTPPPPSSVGAKVMSAVENCLSRSPRPDGERCGLISRSVSLVSVASSEDSCQAATPTPRNVEYDSDVNPEASDSQPAFLQSSLIIQATRSPSVHDAAAAALPARHESPYLRAILDEDANANAVPDGPPKPGASSLPEEEPRAREASEPEDAAAAVVQPLANSVPEAAPEKESTQDLPSTALPPSSISQSGPAEQNPPPPPPPSCDAPVLKEVQSLTENLQTDSSQNEPEQTSGSAASPAAESTNNRTIQLREPVPSPGDQNQQYSESCPASKDKVQEDPDRAEPENTSETASETLRADGAASPVPSTSFTSAESGPGFPRTGLESRCSEDVDGRKSRASGEAASFLLDAASVCSPEHKPEDGTDAQQNSESSAAAAAALVTDAFSEEGRPPTDASPDFLPEPMEATPTDDKPESSSEEQNQSAVLAAAAPADLSCSSSCSGGASSGGSSPQSADRDSDSSGAKMKMRSTDEDADVHVPHPRKRKMPKVPSPPPSSSCSSSSSSSSCSAVAAGAEHQQQQGHQSLAAIVDSVKLEEIEPYQTERANPYYEFLHIRRKIEEKRKVLCSVAPQPPQYYDEYVTFNGSYLLDGNPLSKLCIPTITPPPSLPEQLKEMFKQQEVVRMKLRLQHSIEREKLIVSNEQEVLRVHYRAARTLANQTLPFSACTVLLDAEVYNMPQDVQNEDGKTSVRDRFNARQFMSWLQDVDDKFDKLKTCLLMRQQHEAAALNAVQRLEWQLKLQELEPATYKSTSIFEIPEFYIPLVEVNDDFDLTPI
ncbi:unnamed protein product [Ophioblennius macclurei]